MGNWILEHNFVLFNFGQDVQRNFVGVSLFGLGVDFWEFLNDLDIFVLINFCSLNFGIVSFPCDLSPVNKPRFVGLNIVVNDGSLGKIGPFVGVDDMVEEFVTGDIKIVDTLDGFQLVGAVFEQSILHVGEHDWEGLGLVGVVLPVEAILVGAEDLGEADGVAAEVVDEHVVGLALLADGSLVILGASNDVHVAFAFKEMVALAALEAGEAVTVSLNTLSNLEGMRAC